MILLLGVIESTTPQTSVALIASDTAHALRIGQAVDGYELIGIKDRLVFLQRGVKTFVLRAGDALDDSTPPSFKITTGIERHGDEIVVSQLLRDHIAAEGLVSVLMSAASRPVEKFGRTVGYELFEIDPGSAFDLIGLKDRDVINSIDGVELDSPLVALRVLTSLKDKPAFAFTFTRGGVPETRRVTIR